MFTSTLKKVSALILFFCSEIIFAQSANTRYWVAFTDKNSSPYSVGSPQQYLSQRAINRRTAQSLPITTEDIPVNATYVQQVENTGAVVTCRSRWFNGVVVHITNPSQLTAINALSIVQSTKPLAKVMSHKNIEVTSSNNAASVKKTMAAQGGDRFNYGQSQNQVYMLDGECLHNQGYDGTGMQIGVIDEGFFNATNLDVFDTLWHNHQVLAARDFFTDDTLLYNSTVKGGHGTEVLSCMAANQSGQMIGTAPYAKFYLLRSEIDSVEKIIEEYQWVAAIEYADSAGADVITSSLGYTTFDDASQNHTWADLNGRTSVASISATMAARRGMVVCVAAGNEGCNNSSGSSNQCWQKISVPSDADSILAVGAVDGGGSYAAFSSTGNTADGRIKPDVSAQGQGTAVANTSNSIGPSNGTSFATPTIAGMVACLWQGNPTKTNMEVISAIKKSATQYTSPDSLLGYGIPNFCVADQILKGIYSIHSISNANLLSALCGSENCLLTVNLYDITGREILHTQVQSAQNTTYESILQSVNLSAVSEGLYVVKITSANGNFFTGKLAKA